MYTHDYVYVNTSYRKLIRIYIKKLIRVEEKKNINIE